MTLESIRILQGHKQGGVGSPLRFAMVFLLMNLALYGCASRANRVAGDPLEPMNRAIFGFNTAVDKAVLTPVSKTYRAITPKPARNGLRNFLHNLSSPVILVNDLLQGEWKRAGDTTARFVLNTTVGIGGLFDVAKSSGIERHKEDFGQTMAKAGIKPGPYLVLPLLGPSNFRDAIGRLPDQYFSPLHYTEFEGKNTFNDSRRIADVVDKRSRSLNSVEKLRRNAVDEYANVRNLYRQTREDDIKNGDFEVEALPEFDISSADQ